MQEKVGAVVSVLPHEGEVRLLIFYSALFCQA